MAVVRTHPADVKPTRRLSPFWRHFWEMLAAMLVGMVLAAAIFAVVVHAKSWNQITTQYPTQALVAMALGMTAPMAGWMIHRGMGKRNTAEMSAVMLLAALPFLCLVWFDVTESAQCGGYCLLSVAAMWGLMRYRRTEYAHHPMGEQTGALSGNVARESDLVS